MEYFVDACSYNYVIITTILVYIYIFIFIFFCYYYWLNSGVHTFESKSRCEGMSLSECHKLMYFYCICLLPIQQKPHQHSSSWWATAVRECMYYMNVCLVPGCIVPVCVPAGLGSAGRADDVYDEKRPLTGFFCQKGRVQRGWPLHGSMGPLHCFAQAMPSHAHHVTLKAQCAYI